MPKPGEKVVNFIMQKVQSEKPPPTERMIPIKSFKQSRRWVINPEESFWLPKWEVLMSGALIYVCIATPYEVAFIDEFTEPITSLAKDYFFWLNRLIDLFFILDMVMQFFIMFPVSKRHGTFFVADRALIVRHYLSTWFVIDFISILPFELIGILTSSVDIVKLKTLRAIRLLRLLKLVRIIRGFRILNRWEVTMNVSYRKLTLYGLLVTVFLAAHWMSCALGMLDILQGDTCIDEAGTFPEDCVTTWLSPFLRDLVNQGVRITSFRAYLVSLHVTATILVHPYQANATNIAEQVVFTILVFLGGFIWTRVISRTTAVQSSLDRHSIYYRQTMDDLNSNLGDLMLPAPLQRRLRAFFTNERDHSKRNTWQELTHRMSPALQTEVAVELHKAWLRRVPFLAGISRIFIADLSKRIISEHYAQKEIFGSNFRLYVMNRGLASRIQGFKSRIRLTLPGSVWGMEHLVFHSARLFEPNTSTSITFCEVLVLARSDFEQVKRDYPENDFKIRKYYVKMAIIRGIIVYAREVIAEEKRQGDAEVARISSTCDLASQTGSVDSEEHSSHQHRSHFQRMKRDMDRTLSRMQHTPRRTVTAASNVDAMPDMSGFNYDDHHGHGVIDVHALRVLEEHLTRRIDRGFRTLKEDLDLFKEEIRSDLQEAGVIGPRYNI